MDLSKSVERRMRLHDLRVLTAVVEAGSMNKAAALLHTTQPAVSRSIADLEHTMGVRLLDRNPRGVEPTAYGRALLESGQAVFDELRLAAKRIEALADPTAGELRIACNGSLATSFVSSVIDRVSRQYPRITFRVVIREAELLHRELLDRKVDFLVARRTGGLADDTLGFELLFMDSYVVAGGVQNPWVRRRKVRFEKLIEESWVLPPPNNAIGIVASQAFRASGFSYPQMVVTAAAPEMRISLLTTGRFLSIFPDSILRFPSGRPGLKVVAVKMPVAPVPVGVITLKNRSVSPAIHIFLKHAHAVAKSPGHGH